MPFIANRPKVTYIIDESVWLNICLAATELLRVLIARKEIWDEAIETVAVSSRQIMAADIEALMKRFSSDWFNETPEESTVKINMPRIDNQPNVTFIIDKEIWLNFCLNAITFSRDWIDVTQEITANIVEYASERESDEEEELM